MPSSLCHSAPTRHSQTSFAAAKQAHTSLSIWQICLRIRSKWSLLVGCAQSIYRQITIAHKGRCTGAVIVRLIIYISGNNGVMASTRQAIVECRHADLNNSANALQERCPTGERAFGQFVLEASQLWSAAVSPTWECMECTIRLGQFKFALEHSLKREFN